MGEPEMISELMRITVRELVEGEGISRSLLLELIEYDIARPIAGAGMDDWLFDAEGAHWMKRAIRLQRDLEIDWVAVALLVDLLRERDRLSSENQLLRQRLDRFLSNENT